MVTRNWRQTISRSWVILPAIHSHDRCALCGRVRDGDRIAIFPHGLAGEFVLACPIHQHDIEHWRDRELREEAR